MKRVLMIQGAHLLADGITSLLAREGDLEVVNTTFASGVDLVEHFEETKPSVLIMEENNGLGEISSIIKMLKDNNVVKLIIIDDQKNLIHLYDKKELAVTETADLIEAIQG